MENDLVEQLPDGFRAELAKVGAENGPALLHDWWELVLFTVDELRAALAVVWAGTDAPTEHLGIFYWVEMFRAAGFVSDSGAAAPKSLTVYRGAAWAKRRGMAWTTSRERAREFARATPGDASVFACDVTRAAILAMLGRGDEIDVLVDPEKLPPLGRSAIQPESRA